MYLLKLLLLLFFIYFNPSVLLSVEFL